MSQSNFFPDCFYRVTVKGLYVKDGKVLLVREGDKLSADWEMPGGGLDFGEDTITGLKREIEEEMGLKVSKISNAPVYVWTHKYENKRKIDWFYSCVVAYRVEFENLDFTPSDECEAIEFFSKDELQNVKLCGQAQKLAEIFNPEDFSEPF